MRSPSRARSLWFAALGGLAAFVAWEAARYFLAPGGRRGRFHVESPLFILVALCALTAAGRRAATIAGPAEEDPPRHGLWALVACLLWSLVLYWPALSLGFLSDDFVLVERAQRGTFLVKNPGAFWRPLPEALFGLQSPVALHGLNVLLHGANGWLTARLAAAVGFGRRPALAAAFLFLTFPAGVEAVAWCSGIQDVAMTTAVLACLLAWRLVPGTWAAAAAAALGLIAGLATKETAVVAPALGLALWLGVAPSRRVWRVGGVLAGLTAAFTLWYLATGRPPEAYAQPLSRGLVKELLARSFGGLAAPYHSDLGVLKTALGVATGAVLPALLVMNAASWREDRRSFVLAARLASWVVLAVAPVYAYFIVGPDLQGSRYLYLPAVGWSLLLVAFARTALLRLRASAFLTAGLALVVLAAWGVALRLHLAPWREAAAVRDQVLSAGLAAIPSSDCGLHTSFTDLPDTVRGAYVFRNGFPEALRQAGATWPAGEPCVLRWRDGRFVR